MDDRVVERRHDLVDVIGICRTERVDLAARGADAHPVMILRDEVEYRRADTNEQDHAAARAGAAAGHDEAEPYEEVEDAEEEG